MEAEFCHVAIVRQTDVTGVRYDRRAGGARCPRCATKKASVTNTLPWEGDIRIRYHRCARCGARFKSIEEF